MRLKNIFFNMSFVSYKNVCTPPCKNYHLEFFYGKKKRILLWTELTHWKRLWRWEGLGAGGEGDDRGWDGWMASLTRWTWVSVNSGSWWWTGRPGMLRFMGSQRVGHNWATELNWTHTLIYKMLAYSKIFSFASGCMIN